MECFFCHSPAAHPATGCQYAPNVLACEQCTRDFWAWFRAQQHVRGRPGRQANGRVQADFYTAAGSHLREMDAENV